MNREMALRQAREAVRFNVVSPSLFATEMARALIETPGAWETRRPFVPLDRLGTVEEVAAAVDGGVSAAYVASDPSEGA
jgi:NAD(P)-dependent dehydrogenase (short-subunit alcohol dehydrogenase family)